MSKIMNFLDKVWEYVAYTKIGKLIASLILAISSFALANVLDSMYYVGLVFMIYPVGLFCVMMAYAWVINPIRDWKETKKMKEDYKKELNATQLAETFETPKEIIIAETPKKEAPIKAPEEITKKVTTKKVVAKKVETKKIIKKKK